LGNPHGRKGREQPAGFLRPPGRVQGHGRRIEDAVPHLLRPATEARHDLLSRGLDHAAVLAHVEVRPDESEDADLAAQAQEITISDPGALVSSQARVHQIEVGAQILGGSVASALPLQGAAQSAPDKGEFAPVRFFRRPGRKRGRVVGKLGLVGRDGGLEIGI